LSRNSNRKLKFTRAIPTRSHDRSTTSPHLLALSAAITNIVQIMITNYESCSGDGLLSCPLQKLLSSHLIGRHNRLDIEAAVQPARAVHLHCFHRLNCTKRCRPTPAVANEHIFHVKECMSVKMKRSRYCFRKLQPRIQSHEQTTTTAMSPRPYIRLASEYYYVNRHTLPSPTDAYRRAKGGSTRSSVAPTANPNP
jgi:hypothetical protein